MKAAVFTKFDRLMAAVTFAEANEHTTAREFLRNDEHKDKRATNRPELRKKQTVQKSR